MLAARDGWRVTLAEKRNKPPPDWVDEEPLLLVHHLFYLRAFWHLHRDRQFAESFYGPIPWSSTVAYSDRCGLTGVSADMFVEVIGALDTHWLVEQRKLQEAEQRRSKATSRSGRVS